MSKLILLNLLFLLAAVQINSQNTSQKVVCYYDSRAFGKEGLGKVTIADIEPGLSYCTHLVYGFAGINENKRVISQNANQDLDQGKGGFRLATQLKRKFPGLKVLLGVGGDTQNTPDQYLSLLESSQSRITFINSAYDLIKSYDFDGLDLAYEFPKIKPKKIRSSVGSAWYSFKKAVGAAGKEVDPKSDEHKEEFTALVRELKNSFRAENYQLSVTILPNVNSSLYLDVPSILNNVDFINLAVFDVQTPARNDKEADFSAPLYAPSDRNPELNIDYQVKSLMSRGFPANKIVIGIPTFGRVWSIKDGATSTGVPPIEAEGPAPEGIQSKHEGFLSYPEICAKLTNPQNKELKGENGPIRKVGDPSKRFGTYGFRLPDSSGQHGLWVSYEDTDTAGNKASYARTQGLAGVAIFDLTQDDFRGACQQDKFPILKSARARLQ